MATVNYIQEKMQTKAVMKRVIDYCSQEKKTIDEETGIRYLSGINCKGEDAFSDFMATKEVFKKTTRTQFYHYDQSFDPMENVSPETAHEIAKKFAEKAWPGHEVLVATHLDATHMHSHFVINSVSFETGMKLRQSPNTLKELRKLNDDICRSYGLTTLPAYDKTKLKGQSTREYRAAKKGTSWKDELRYDIDRAMLRARTKEEFIGRMEEFGYEVKWTTDRKSITYTCPSGKKCRDNKLQNEKYLKPNMETELKIRHDTVPFPLPITGWESQRKQLLKMKKIELQKLGMALKLGNMVASLVPYDGGSDDPEDVRRDMEMQNVLDTAGVIFGGTLGVLLVMSEISEERRAQQERYAESLRVQEEQYSGQQSDDNEDEEQGFSMIM